MSIGIARTRKGVISGVTMPSYTVFKGIPYAKPPVGELRFKRPQETEPWEGIFEAFKYSCISMQMGQQEGSFYQKEFYTDDNFMSPTSEDSLYLNIWTPANFADEKLPVAFWIHGGAFLNGFGHEIEFDGEAYCKNAVILVTINYRLGVFGFLAHEWLAIEDKNNSSGNYGILDQIAALNWVYENIDAFGGDPEKITVMGQSAGSLSVQTLVSSSLTKGKINKAILQSAGGYNSVINRDRSFEKAKEIGNKFVAICGSSSLEELRELSADTVLTKSNGLSFAPVIDNYVLEDGYNAIIEAGKLHDIPYMIGSTKNDIGVTSEMIETHTKSPLYNGFINWSLALERQEKKPAYVYYFTHQLLGDDAGAFHSSELWYIFKTLYRSWRPKEEIDYQLSETMVSYWTNFIKTGDPNSDSLPIWKPCTKSNPYVHELY